MRTLGIDFASHEGHLACVEDSDVCSLLVLGRVNDAEFIALIEDVLNKAGWTKKDIGRIACNIGPGGFTSVRNGVAFANALADQLKIPLAGYHGSALALARCHGSLRLCSGQALPLTMTTTLWVHSAKAEALFVLGGPWSEPTLVSLANVLAVIASGTFITGDLLDVHREALANAGAVFPEKKPLKEVLPAFLDGLEYSTNGLVPWYGRGIS